METVGEALPKEMARVRDEIMPAYIEIGASGSFALSIMRADLDYAARCLAEQDVVGMIQALQKLREYSI